MPSREKLKENFYYHIFNRGNNGTIIFPKHEDYISFLKKYCHYCFFVLDTYAFCMMGNHFHFLIRIRTQDEQKKLKLHNPFGVDEPEKINLDKIHSASRQLSHLFNSHAQSINKKYSRTGSLFEKPFHRKSITKDDYFSHLICYIHWNPQIHGFVKDFRFYSYSSYKIFLTEKKSRLNKEKVLNWFGGVHGFKEAHYELPKGLSRDYLLETKPKFYRK